MLEVRIELSHYDDVLEELREKGQMLAVKYIVELYNILRDEEKLPPRDCRAKIEHDCLDLWSKATIRKYLPDEAKDTLKQKAGKTSANVKKTMLVVANTSGSVGTNLTENDSDSQKEQESDTFRSELDQWKNIQKTRLLMNFSMLSFTVLKGKKFAKLLFHELLDLFLYMMKEESNKSVMLG
jgi:hypothetical protein